MKIESGELLAVQSTLLVVSVALLGVAVALAAIVPTLVEIARVRGSDYFSSQKARRAMKTDLVLLEAAIWLYAGSALCSSAGIVWYRQLLAAVAGAMFVIGLVTLLAASVRLVREARSVL